MRGAERSRFEMRRRYTLGMGGRVDDTSSDSRWEHTPRSDADGHGARVMQKRIEDQLASLNARRLLPAPLALTIGCTRVRSTDPANIGELLARADQLLYARKRRRALAAAAATAKPARAPRRTPRTLPPVPIPPDVAAVAMAMAAARSLPSPLAVAAATALPPAMPMERGVTSPA